MSRKEGDAHTNDGREQPPESATGPVGAEPPVTQSFAERQEAAVSKCWPTVEGRIMDEIREDTRVIHHRKDDSEGLLGEAFAAMRKRLSERFDIALVENTDTAEEGAILKILKARVNRLIEEKRRECPGESIGRVFLNLRPGDRNMRSAEGLTLEVILREHVEMETGERDCLEIIGTQTEAKTVEEFFGMPATTMGQGKPEIEEAFVKFMRATACKLPGRLRKIFVEPKEKRREVFWQIWNLWQRRDMGALASEMIRSKWDENAQYLIYDGQRGTMELVSTSTLMERYYVGGWGEKSAMLNLEGSLSAAIKSGKATIVQVQSS